MNLSSVLKRCSRHTRTSIGNACEKCYEKDRPAAGTRTRNLLQLSNEPKFIQIGSAISEKQRNRADRICVGGYVTFSIMSPEPEIPAIIRLNMINDPIIAFKRAFCPNQFSHLLETCAEKKKCEFLAYGYISGTGSVRHEPSNLD